MDFKKRLEQDGALRYGHFVYVSGKHAPTYVNKTVAFVRSGNVMAFAKNVAECFIGGGIHVLVAPELGAISFAAHVQRYLADLTGRDIFLVIATKVREPHTDPVMAKEGYTRETGEFEITRDQARFLEGKRVLMIEDIFSTGGSIQRALKPVRAAGGIPVAVALLWNQGGVSAEAVGIDSIYPLIEEKMVMWTEEECVAHQLCHKGVSINTEVGKGKSFLARQTQTS